MLILQVNTQFAGGGAANVANSLHNYINRETPHESFFIYGTGPDGDEKSLRIQSKPGRYLSAFFERYLGFPFVLNSNSAIEDCVRKADAVHIHNLHGYYLDYFGLVNLLIKHRKPVVWTMHDMWPITGRCTFSGECSRWKTGCGKCGQKDLYPKTIRDLSGQFWWRKQKLFNSLDKNSTLLVTPSRWLAEYVRHSYLGGFDTKVIPNGINEPVSYPNDKRLLKQRLNLPPNSKIVLFVTGKGGYQRKGIPFILNSINRFESDVLFVSVGQKIDCLNPQLLQMGYVSSRNVIKDIYRAADVFVIPSLEDNFPTTVLEAFSNGLPVVGFATGGITEQLDDNCGICVKKGGSDGFENAIKTILRDEDVASSISKSCVEKFKKYYTLEKCAGAYVCAYESFAANAAGKSADNGRMEK